MKKCVNTTAPRQLLDLSHGDARRALAGGAPVYLPVNPVEYHGPHLSLHNDRLITEGLMADVHAGLGETFGDWPLLCVADLEVGVDAVGGPGARPVPYAVVSRLIRDACQGLADLGAQRVILMTFHGSPLHGLALEEGVSLLRRLGVQVVNPLNALLRLILQGELKAELDRLGLLETGTGPALREGLEQSLRFDYHAGLLETSLSLHYAPESVDPGYRDLAPCPQVVPIRSVQAAARLAKFSGREGLAQELEFAALGLAWQALDPCPGYTGTPHLASASLGAVLARAASDLLARVVRDVFSGAADSPAPLMGWLGPLTLGGRLDTSITSRRKGR
jgi:creatinine amidohydrolase